MGWVHSLQAGKILGILEKLLAVWIKTETAFEEQNDSRQK